MQELSSKPFIDTLHFRIKERAAALIDRGIDPHVAVVLVGEDPESLKYVSIKEKRAKEDGIILSLYHLGEEAPFEEVMNTLQYLAGDADVHGIVLQLPLPAHFKKEQLEALIQLIPAEKDVDGLRGEWQHLTYTRTDTDSLSSPQHSCLPPMVLAVMSLLNHYNIEVDGKKIVIVGRGRLVGMPLEAFFKKLSLDVMSVDEFTEEILSQTKTADLLITGTGEKDLITYQWVKQGAVVIECAGDIHRNSVEQVASALTPEKGGIGPLTVAWLLSNVLNAAEGNRG